MPTEPPAADLLAGRYQLGEVLGRGATGEVRAGWDHNLDRPVALKLLRADAGADLAARRRFEMEGRAAAALAHPNVVAVYDTGDPGCPGVPYIVMERLPGTTLKDAIGAGPLPVREVRSLAVQILSALEAAHRAGLVHRDIKPGNVLAAGPGVWKLGDFGIAKTLDAAPDQTSTGLVVGTPAYLAPERLYGRPATVATEVFAMGVVLYEALTGRRPFETSSDYPWSGALAGVPPVRVRAVRPEVDRALAAAVEKALHPDPSRRFASALAMVAALADAGPGRPSAWPERRPWRSGRRAGRSRARGGLVGLGAAVVGAGAAAAVAAVLVGSAAASPGTPKNTATADNTVPAAAVTGPAPAAAPAVSSGAVVTEAAATDTAAASVTGAAVPAPAAPASSAPPPAAVRPPVYAAAGHRASPHRAATPAAGPAHRRGGHGGHHR